MAIDSFRAFLLAAAVSAIPASGHAQQDTSELPFQKSDSRPAGATALKPGANSFAESQARTLLESQGYSQISTLVIDSNGIWRGMAHKDDHEVEVSVDFQGHVAAK